MATYSPWHMNTTKYSARELTILAVCTALLFAVQVALAGLPNIELVSLLVILYTITFQKKALLPIYSFVVLQGLLYGFHLWWFMYLYVWFILWLVVMFFGQQQRSVLQWALLSGIYGLLFGGLCAVSYLPFSGIAGAIAWWIAGIPSDFVHGIGNFIVTLVLFQPLHRIMSTLKL